ncbi:MAG: hypothetical protein ACK40L_14745, partial [Hydrogenophaga sp.]
MNTEAKCPFTGTEKGSSAPRARGNSDWWPNQLNLGILHQHSARANPLGKDFDYAKEFKTLDLDAVV